GAVLHCLRDLGLDLGDQTLLVVLADTVGAVDQLRRPPVRLDADAAQPVEHVLGVLAAPLEVERAVRAGDQQVVRPGDEDDARPALQGLELDVPVQAVLAELDQLAVRHVTSNVGRDLGVVAHAAPPWVCPAASAAATMMPAGTPLSKATDHDLSGASIPESSASLVSTHSAPFAATSCPRESSRQPAAMRASRTSSRYNSSPGDAQWTR